MFHLVFSISLFAHDPLTRVPGDSPGDWWPVCKVPLLGQLSTLITICWLGLGGDWCGLGVIVLTTTGVNIVA